MCVPGGWLYPSLMGTNSSFRREALAAIGLFDETYEYYLDETDVAVRMVDAGYVVLGIDGAPVHHHFLPSHLRNEAKVVTHWYPVVKNRTYFAMRHARSHRPVTDVIRAAIDAGDVRLAESDSAEQAGLIAKGSTDRARVDADRGLLDGIVLGERAGSKCAPAVTLSPPPFVRFPTLPHANRLRIGLVSAGYPPRPMAGIARFMSELAPALAALGHDVRVFTRATGHPTVEWEDGVWVHRIGDQHRGLVPGSFDHVDDFATGVVREIERIQPWLPLDCVYGGAWDVETIGVVRATEIPTTIMLATPAREAAEHGGWLADPAIAPGLRALFDLERELFAGAHHVHGISQAVVHTIDQLYREPFTEVPVTVAPIGVRDRHVHELRDAQASPTVLFVGRLEQRKGIDIFLQAVATAAPLHPSAHFQVAGADPAGIAEQWRLDHAGDELADRVEFLGEVDDEQLHHLYASAHIVVLPSRYESFGLVVVEAMMHGAAVLSTDIGGIAEVTRDGIDAVLVPPADAPALAAAMSALLDDPARRAALGDEARRRFLQHFDIARVAPAIVDMLRASIAAHQVG
ncbi:MAG: glycosyltransferase [Actinobacteria bacterium]|nr:glycosyltransferase [Actinomycetota bacterium]